MLIKCRISDIISINVLYAYYRYQTVQLLDPQCTTAVEVVHEMKEDCPVSQTEFERN